PAPVSTRGKWGVLPPCARFLPRVVSPVLSARLWWRLVLPLPAGGSGQRKRDHQGGFSMRCAQAFLSPWGGAATAPLPANADAGRFVPRRLSWFVLLLRYSYHFILHQAI